MIGEIDQVKFNEKEHTYELNGYYLPSVNHIFNCVGGRKNREDYLNSVSGCEFFSNTSALDFGNGMHKLIAHIEMGDKVEWGEDIQPYIDSYKMFGNTYTNIKTCQYKDCSPTIEYSMGSMKLGYAGTPDKIGYEEFSGMYYIVDWKTGKSKEKKWALQFAAYAKLFSTIHLTGKLDNVRAISVRIRDGKKPLINRYPTQMLYENWLIFEGMLKTYQYFNPLKKVEVDEKKMGV